MMRQQYVLDLNREIFVDGFAGGGGASTGIYMALNRHVDHAFNHAQDALGMHRINHPQTVHHCEDIFDVDPWAVAEGRPVGGGWFSPDCKHFSKAKGGKPLSKKIRGLAFSILRWAKIRTRVIYMENVEEIQTWGPLDKEGNAIKNLKGRTFKAFIAALGDGVDPGHPDIPEMLEVLKAPEDSTNPLMTITKADLVQGFGYHVETREIRAFVYGTATIRKRLYMIARCDGRPIIWPEYTHGDPRLPETKEKRLKPWNIIADCIDWKIPCKSIFLTPAEAKVQRCRRPLARSTLRRIATGVDRYVLKAKRPFLVSLTHQGGERVESVDEPVRTLTAAHRGEKAVVAPVMSPEFGTSAGYPVDKPSPTCTTRDKNTLVAAHLERYNGDHEGREDGAARSTDLNNPISTQDTSNRFGLVNAELAAPFISEHANASNQRNMPADEPGRTQCAEVKGGHFSLVAAHMVQHGHLKSNSKMVKGADEPMRCQTTRVEHGVVAATMVQTGYGEAPGQKPRALDIEKPGGTIVSGGKQALVTANIVKLRGTNIGSGAEEPLHTASAGGTHHGLVTGTLVGAGGPVYSGKPKPVDEPMNTQTTENHSALAAVYLAQHNGGFNETPGHPADEPASTISAKGSQQQVVAGTLAAYYGNDQDGQGVDEPARTVTTKERFGFVESQAVTPALTEEQLFGARRVAAFLREHGVVFEGDFATVAGYVIVDLGMRMLTPRELFRAQGFSDDYIIDRAWVVDPKTGDVVEITLTKEQQIRMCGNSVCPDVAAALVKANSGDMAVPEKRGRQRMPARRVREVVAGGIAA